MRLIELFESKTNPVSVEVWHGTNIKFDQFNKEMARAPNDLYGGGLGYFTDSLEVAKGYARTSVKRAKVSKEAQPYIYRVQLTLDNVFDVEKTYSGNFVASFLKSNSYSDAESFLRTAGMAKMGTDLPLKVSQLRNGQLEMLGDDLFKALSKGSVNSTNGRNTLIASGFDGLRYPGGIRSGTKGLHNVYIAYENDKIKILETHPLNS